MTSKTYKTAQGKTIDLGTIMLQNENTRAVGNMNVNARGDRLDSGNQVIETKPQRIQRQNARTTTAVVPATTVHTSTTKAKQAQKQSTQSDEVSIVQELQEISDIVNLDPITEPAPVDTQSVGGGLAAAIARSKIVKQEKEKTLREITQSTPGVRRI